jgi:type IV pilus assembly protein pilZ
MAGELVQARSILAIGQRLEIFFENSEEGTSGYTSRVEDIVGDELVVAMPLDERRVPVIPRVGENLYVLAGGDGCHYRFFSVHRSHGRHEGRIPVLHISIPEVAERFQKRGLFRIKVNLTATVRLVDSEGKIDAPKRVPVVDLSGSGLAFAWPKSVGLESDAALEINDIPGIGTLEVMTRVMRCTRIEREDDTPIYHIGVQFQEISRSMRDKIIRYLFQVQRAQVERVKND